MVDLFSLAALQDTAKLIEVAGKLPVTIGVLNDLDETGVIANIGEAEAVLKSIGIPVAPVQSSITVQPTRPQLPGGYR